MKRELPRIGGLRMDPLADMALPLLLLLFTAVGVQLVAGTARLMTDQPLLPYAGLWAFLVAAESYLFTTIFIVRDLDRPWMLRLAEAGVMMFLDWLLAALPLTGGVAAAFLVGAAQWEVWVGAGLLLFAWLQGARLATLIGPLHPGLAEAQGEEERLPHNDHVHALAALRNLVLVQVVVIAVLAGLTGAGASGPLLLTGLAAGALLVGTRLKQAVTWGLERVAPSPAVAGRWIQQGLALMLLPVLLALLLPAGPRLPVERLLALLGERGEQGAVEIPPVEPPNLSAPQFPGGELGEMEPLRGLDGVWIVLKWVLAAAAALALLAFLAAAARQFADRVGREQLKGVWRVLAAVAAWYAALWLALRDLLGGVLRQAAAVPAETLGALLARGGALARFLPALGRAPGEPRAALRWYFGRLQREAARKGLRRRPGETAAEFAARLAGAAPDQAAALLELRDAYQTARYTDEPIKPEQVSFARRTWLQIARALRRT